MLFWILSAIRVFLHGVDVILHTRCQQRSKVKFCLELKFKNVNT